MAAYEERQRRRIKADLERAAERVIKVLAVNITANLVERTPVDTGWAKSNWIPSVGESVSEPQGSKENVGQAAAAQAGGQARVLGYKLSKRNVFISNNVPYISLLNDGHSKQAPAGFVQVEIEQGIRELRFIRL